MQAGQAMLGASRAIRALQRRIARVAPTEATVLIQGERGTGKELVARAVHDASRRRHGPCLALNCAALPDELLASELFGHARGAFTGAVQRAPGLLVVAEGGTAFLDEVGDLSLRGQAMLLRFLEVREVRPLGVAAPRRVDVRVVAATNRDLLTAVARGEFRADLHDRLSEVVLEVPPLRERREDVRLLAEHFVGVYARRHGVAVHGVTRQAVRALCAYDWPGNVRELEKAISRGVIFCEGGWVRAEDLELPDFEAGGRTAVPAAAPGLTPRQEEALALARRHGSVRRRDLMGRFAISGEAARRELAGLVRAGLLRREGNHRGARYRPVGPDPGGPDAHGDVGLDRVRN
jgi:DNA-binding NtrC family response regulator